MKRKTLISLATGAAIAALWPTAARAERDLSLLMNMDHHLVRADFIAVVQIDAQALFTDASGVPLQSVVLDASNVLASRWSDTNFEVITSAGFDHFEMGAEYLVLMSGGPWAESPFTHRVNSVFRVEPDGTLSCSGGDRLYGVFGDGLITTVFPAATGAAADPARIASGKFHGGITTPAPIGWRVVTFSSPSWG